MLITQIGCTTQFRRPLIALHLSSYHNVGCAYLNIIIILFNKYLLIIILSASINFSHYVSSTFAQLILSFILD